MKSYVGLFDSNPKKRNPETDKLQLIRIIKKTTKRLEIITPFHLTCLEKSLIAKSLSTDIGLKSKIEIKLNKTNGNLQNAHAEIKYNFPDNTGNLVFIV